LRPAQKLDLFPQFNQLVGQFTQTLECQASGLDPKVRKVNIAPQKTERKGFSCE